MNHEDGLRGGDGFLLSNDWKGGEGVCTKLSSGRAADGDPTVGDGKWGQDWA